MIIYNTTFHIAFGILSDGIEFLKNEYIPSAIKDGTLFNPRLCKILFSDAEEGESFSVQFHVKDIDTLNRWLEKDGKMLHHTLTIRFKNNLVGFSTLLEEIDINEHE